MDDQGKAGYYAFVSHKSADKVFALKLRKFIESYKLPAHIRKKVNAPKRLSPLCCYEDDFSAKPLYDEMQEKLSRSQYLIVICSKDQEPGGSPYINFEIETFIAQKRAEGIDPLTRIIPVVLNGAFGSPTEECCPAALQALGENLPIALECKKFRNNRKLFLRIISALLALDPSVIENRDRKRRKRKGVAWAAAALLTLAAAGGILLWQMPHHQHYVDFAMKNGIPVGIGKLSKSEYKKMTSHYVLTTRQGKVTELRLVNSVGTLIDHGELYSGKFVYPDRVAKYTFDYDSRGLRTVTYYDRAETPYFVLHYTDETLTTADLRSGNNPYYIGSGYESDPAQLLEGTGFYSLPPHTSTENTEDGAISRFSYTYNADGFVTKLLFHADSSNKSRSDQGVYGFAYEPDEKGRIRKMYFLDIAGNRHANSKGVYCTEYIYDTENNLTELIHYDTAGKPVSGTDGVMHLRRTFDENHNVVCLEQLNSEGVLACDNKTYGAAITLYIVNRKGQVESVVYLDEKQQFYYDDIFGQQFSYDENGRITTEAFISHSDCAFMLKKHQYDALGRTICAFYTDPYGFPVNFETYCRVECTYDAAGRATSWKYYDAEGKPADYEGYGYSSRFREYDSQGRMIAETFWGLAGEPVNIKGPSDKYGYHKYQAEYEDMGNGFTKETATYYDKDGQPVVFQSDSSIKEPYAQSQAISQDGYLVTLVFYDTGGIQVGDRYELSRSYNAQAEMVETSKTFDADGLLTYSTSDTYYHRGTIKEMIFESFDHMMGFSRQITINTYRENGTLAERRFFGYDENENLAEEHCRRYDENNNEIFLSLTNTVNGSHSELETLYDQQGRVCQKTWKNYDDNVLDYTSVDRRTYAEDGSYLEETTYYDADGTVIGTDIYHYDSEGNRIKDNE